MQQTLPVDPTRSPFIVSATSHNGIAGTLLSVSISPSHVSRKMAAFLAQVSAQGSHASKIRPVQVGPFAGMSGNEQTDPPNRLKSAVSIRGPSCSQCSKKITIYIISKGISKSTQKLYLIPSAQCTVKMCSAINGNLQELVWKPRSHTD